MDADDRKLFADALRQTVELHAGGALDGSLDSALDELGWNDALDHDPRDAVALLFQLQGAANATSSGLDSVLAEALGLPSGTAILLPALGQWTPPGEVFGDRLRVRGIATGELRDRDRVAIAWGEDETSVTVVFPKDLQLRPISGMDPALGLLEVTADLPLGELSLDASDWMAAIAAGRLALAYEIVGACQAMLRLAREHALERVQFGRPIAGFQAVRHRLAESLVAIEGAQACADAAWEAADDDPLPAMLAKAVAGAAARTVGKHAQQVLGGMGYTTDHSLHRYVRRTLVLDQLLGASRSLTREIGEDLLHTRELPELLPL